MIILWALVKLWQCLVLGALHMIRSSGIGRPVRFIYGAMYPNHPNLVLHPDHISSSTLSTMLSTSVKIVGTCPLGDGKMSNIRRISYIHTVVEPTHDLHAHHQTHHLVCKTSPSSLAEFIFTLVFDLHRNEYSFLSVPRCVPRSPDLLYSYIDWTGQYVFLMEYVEGTSPSSSQGISDVRTIDNIVKELAHFHSRSCKPANPETYSTAYDQALGPIKSWTLGRVLSSIWREFASYAPEPVRRCGGAIDLYLAHILSINRVLLTEYPTCLTHGDVHCANMVITADQRMVLLDWQSAAIRPMMYDLCYFLGTSVPIQIRRDNLSRWLDLYWKELGLGHVSREMIDDQFPICMVSVLLPIIFMGFLIKQNRENGMIHYESTGKRAIACLQDSRLEERLEKLVNFRLSS